MNDHHTTFGAKIASALSWLAAALGLGTFAGVVSLAVGVLSAAWLIVQLIGYFKYDLPVKRARALAAHAGRMDLCDTESDKLRD
jgi:hypothetical protein